MKKIFWLLLILSAAVRYSHAQVSNWRDYSQSFTNGTMDKPSNIGLITAELMINNSFWNAYPYERLQTYLSNDTSFQNSRPKEIVVRNTFDTSKGQFFLHGVNKINAAQYEFRVLQGMHKTILPWSAITQFTDASFIAASSLPQMAYLGGYKAPFGSMIVIDVRDKGSHKIIACSVVAWQSVKPLIADIYTANELNLFLTRLSRPWSIHENRWKKSYSAGQIDPQTQLPKTLKLLPNDNNLIFYLTAQTYKKEQIEYELIKNGTVLNSWRHNEFDNNFIWLKNLTHGQYLIKIRYSAQRQNVTRYAFEIQTAWYQSVWLKVLSSILILAFIGFIIIAIMLFKQKKRAEKELSKKTKLQLEIKAIHSQLNPHFVFNALNSIQGLINKQDIAGANKYLSAFGQLMRNSLSNNDRDQITLFEEIKILETYLKLEQLRFGFEYHINISEDINVYETDIPSLLLQPLIENGIKHGISGLKQKGNITLDFVKIDKDMVVTVKDNGKGFSLTADTIGYGLKLTKDRIKLLNQMKKDQSVDFEIQTGTGTPTTIVLTFKKWFV